MNDPVRLMLVDDQELVRAGFAMVLDSCDDLSVVAQAGDGEEALAMLETTGVDVVLMDVRMPQLDGIEATRRAVAHQALVVDDQDADGVGHGGSYGMKN